MLAYCPAVTFSQCLGFLAAALCLAPGAAFGQQSQQQQAQDQQAPQHTAPVQDVQEDPYAPIGVRAGSFILYPSIDALGGYTDNADRTAGPKRSSFLYTLAPALDARSDWSRHSFSLNLRGSYTGFTKADGAEEGSASARSTLGLELGARTLVELTGGVELISDDDLIDTVYSAGAAVTHRFNRLSVTLRGQIRDFGYDSRTTSLGSLAEDNVADYQEQLAGLRMSYEMSSALSIFTDGSVNQRVFDNKRDPGGTLRGSDGYRAAIGAAFAPTGKLNGEISVGYLEQTLDDPGFDTVGAFTIDASLSWRPSALTTATLAVSTDFGETTLAGSPGYISRNAVLGVRHALRTNIIVQAAADYQLSEFESVDIDEETIQLGAGVEYLLNPSLALIAGVEHEWFDSTLAGADYEATTISAGIRLRR